MAKQIIHDEFFGPLEWDRLEFGWTTRIDHPFFQKSGSLIPRDPSAERIAESMASAPESADPSLAPTRRAFDLLVGVEEDRQPPSPGQYHAWRQIMDNSEAVCGDIMQQALAMYQRQRDMRIYWWKEIYGADDPLLPQVLPLINDIQTLFSYIRPRLFKIHRDWLDNGKHVIGIHFDSAWDRAGFGVRVEEGKLVDLGDESVAIKRPPRSRTVEHPVFGKIKVGEWVWEGVFHWEPMRKFNEIVENRSWVKEHPSVYDRSFLPSWNFADGRFDLVVPVENGQPLAESMDVFKHFTADPQRSADQVLMAIFNYYNQFFDKYHEAWEDEDDANLLMPRIESVDDLRPLMTFQTLRIFRAEETGELSVGLGFHCSWEQEHGLGVRWRDGKVEDVGTAEMSFT